MASIGKCLAQYRPDVIGLQESISSCNRAILLQALNEHSGLGYKEVYFSSRFGSGLAVLSHHEVEETFFLRYDDNCSWLHFGHLDWYAGKGVGLVRLRVTDDDGQEVGILDFFNTHAVAAYDKNSHREDRCKQMGVLNQFVDDAALGTAPCIVVGDLNCTVLDREYVRATGRVPEAGSIQRTAHLASLIPDEFDVRHGYRIDHVLALTNDIYEYETLCVAALEGQTTVRGKAVNLSDHVGYVVRVNIKPK